MLFLMPKMTTEKKGSWIQIIDTALDMTTVFYTWPNGRFIEMQSNPRKKKLHRMNQGSNFLGGNFGSKDNVRAPIQFRRESPPNNLKNDFSS